MPDPPHARGAKVRMDAVLLPGCRAVLGNGHFRVPLRQAWVVGRHLKSWLATHVMHVRNSVV